MREFSFFLFPEFEFLFKKINNKKSTTRYLHPSSFDFVLQPLFSDLRSSTFVLRPLFIWVLFFGLRPSFEKKKMPNLPPPTQTALRSKVVYHWVFLFMYNIEVEFPFSCVHVKDLEDSEFPFDLVDGPLDDESRKRPFHLFSGLNYCLFAKIQEGKSTINPTDSIVSYFLAQIFTVPRSLDS